MSVTVIRQRDGAALTWDAATLESYDPTIEVTNHPVERGVDVSDHAQPQPLRFQIRVVQTESPFLVGPTTAGIGRVLDALAFLRSLEGELCNVVTSRLGTITDCLLTGYPHEITTRRALPAVLRFQQIRIAAVQAVTIPPLEPVEAAQTGFPDEQDAGQQATQDTADDPAKQERDTSTLFDLGEAVGVF